MNLGSFWEEGACCLRNVEIWAQVHNKLNLHVYWFLDLVANEKDCLKGANHPKQASLEQPSVGIPVNADYYY